MDEQKDEDSAAVGMSHERSPHLERTRTGEIRHDYERQHSNASVHQPEDVAQLVDWDGPNDPANPFNWPKRRKVIMTVVSLLGTLTVLINGTSITVAAADINDEFGISDASFPNSYWPISSWTLGGGLFMIVILPLMEDLGVRTGYMVCDLQSSRPGRLLTALRSRMLHSSYPSWRKHWQIALPL